MISAILESGVSQVLKGVVVAKFDKFHHHWPTHLLKYTISPHFCVYMYEMHFLMVLDNFFLTRAGIRH